jgi:hypothetical protein
LSRVNILKRVKIGARWKLLSIPRNDKGNPNWAALPEGRYFIEWYLGGKRRREFGGTTVAQALESQRRKRHELEGRHLGLPGFDKAGEQTKNPPLHVAVSHYLDQVETLKNQTHCGSIRRCWNGLPSISPTDRRFETSPLRISTGSSSI